MAQLTSAPQIFSELDQAGSMLVRETLEDGFSVHDGKGDVRKCPYYAAQADKGKLWVLSLTFLEQVCHCSPLMPCLLLFVLHAGTLEGSTCPFRTAMAVLRKPSLQLILAASVALAAGLFAWYYM